MATNLRQQKGETLANKGQLTRIDDNTYEVKSQSGNGEYEVIASELGWLCSCPDHMFRGVTCKHIHAVEFSLTLRNTIAKVTTIAPVTTSACIFCKSPRIVKDGLRHNKHGDIQKFNCKDCNHYFTINLGFEKMHATPQVITSALQLYFTGESLRNVQKFLRLQGVNINHNTVYKWIKKYVTLMQKYLEQMKPKVSDVWRTDGTLS